MKSIIKLIIIVTVGIFYLDSFNIIMAGEIIYANQVDPGWNSSDATECLANAIQQAVAGDKIIVKKMSSSWQIKSIFLKTGITLELETGVIIEAKNDPFFYDGNKRLFYLRNIEDVAIIGPASHDATIKMRQQDYTAPPYAPSEHRHAIDILNSKNIKIKNIIIKDTGGDGIYIGKFNGSTGTCKNITISNVNINNAYRNGISVITGNGITIEDCEIIDTSGVNPQAGLDIEPNDAADILKNINISRCNFTNNTNAGISITLARFSAANACDINIQECNITGPKGVGIDILGSRTNTWQHGQITISNCQLENLEQEGILIKERKRVEHPNIRFENCNLINVATKYNDGLVNGNSKIYYPIRLNNETTLPMGNIDFVNLYVYDIKERVVVKYTRTHTAGLKDISGDISVNNPNHLNGITVKKLFIEAEQYSQHNGSPIIRDNGDASWDGAPSFNKYILLGKAGEMVRKYYYDISGLKSGVYQIWIKHYQDNRDWERMPYIVINGNNLGRIVPFRHAIMLWNTKNNYNITVTDTSQNNEIMIYSWNSGYVDTIGIFKNSIAPKHDDNYESITINNTFKDIGNKLENINLNVEKY